MDFIEKTGKTVEDALNDALAELKTTADKVNVEVIEEAKNGIFGLFAKKAKIRVTLKDAARKKEEAKPAVREHVIEEAAVEAAKEFLQKIFNAMRIEVVMEKFINKNEGMVTFKLHGSDMGILIGKHGQTLDSLQYLTNLVANKNSAERIRIVIDIEDYRERRVETLNRLALRLADKVKRTGERVVLEPMNPHERKIIHVALHFLNFKPSRLYWVFLLENRLWKIQQNNIRKKPSALFVRLWVKALSALSALAVKTPLLPGR